jgi:mono/diheme cytochrome c family protein
MTSVLRLSAGAAFGASLLFLGSTPALAMPNFAQAYGVSCSTCHTAVPALNSY